MKRLWHTKKEHKSYLKYLDKAHSGLYDIRPAERKIAKKKGGK